RLSPFPFLNDFRVGLFDEHTDPSEHLVPPITQRVDSLVTVASRLDRLSGGWRILLSASFLRAVPLLRLHGFCGFLHGSTASSVMEPSRAGRPPARIHVAPS